MARGKWRGVKVGCVGLLGLLVLLGALVLWRVLAKDAAYEQAIEALREAGEPTSMAELETFYPLPPEEENAAIPLRQAAAVKSFLTPEEMDFVPIAGNVQDVSPPLPPQVVDASKAHLNANAERLELLAEAATRPEYRPVNLALETGVMPRMAEFRDHARTLSLAALIAAEEGRAAAAADYVGQHLALAQHMNREPNIMGLLVQIAVVNMGGYSLERSLERVDFSAEELADLRNGLQRLIRSPRVHIFRGERAYTIDTIRQLGAHNLLCGSLPANATVPERFVFMVRKPLSFLRDDRARLLERFQGIIEISKIEDATQRNTAVRAFVADWRANVATDGGQQLLDPDMPSILSAQLFCDAMLLCADTALAVEQYRLAEGRPPASLQELVPAYLDAVPRDPFIDAPLRYNIREDAAVVYSVGYDRDDDGGVPPPDGQRRTRDGDECFEVPLIRL